MPTKASHVFGQIFITEGNKIQNKHFNIEEKINEEF